MAHVTGRCHHCRAREDGKHLTGCPEIGPTIIKPSEEDRAADVLLDLAEAHAGWVYLILVEIPDAPYGPDAQGPKVHHVNHLIQAPNPQEACDLVVEWMMETDPHLDDVKMWAVPKDGVHQFDMDANDVTVARAYPIGVWERWFPGTMGEHPLDVRRLAEGAADEA